MDTPEMTLVREMYATSNRGDCEAALLYFDPDVELIVPDTLPDPGAYAGREALFGYFSNWYTELFDSFVVEVKELTQYGDAVVVEHRLRGTGHLRTTTGEP